MTMKPPSVPPQSNFAGNAPQQSPAGATGASALQSAYRAAVEQWCQLLQLPDVDNVANGGLVDVDGVYLSVTLNTVQPQSPAVSLYVDMGAPPAQREAAVLRMLLQQNFHISAVRGPSFCISPITGRVLCVAHLPVEGLTGELLNSVVQPLVDRAIEWENTYFLWSDDSVASTKGRVPNPFGDAASDE